MTTAETSLKKDLHNVTKKYVCDICKTEYNYHSKAAECAQKCKNYSIDEDPRVKRV